MRKSFFSNVLILLKQIKTFNYHQLTRVETFTDYSKLRRKNSSYKTSFRHVKNEAEERENRDKHRDKITSEEMSETEYYFENGLRKVYPYHTSSGIRCHLPWHGTNIVDFMLANLRSYPEEYYIKRLVDGHVTVNDRKVGINYNLQKNDILKYKFHRHEMPVGNFPVVFLHVSDDLVVIDKPPSVSVIPMVHFRHNSLLFILAKEFGLKTLFGVHRLDRLTSGVLILARTSKKAWQLQEELSARTIKKEYLCRVEGEFPKEKVTCKAPIAKLSPKKVIYHVDENGKSSETEFYRLSFDGTSSLVLCRPRTGRTHQIRVHLQYLGYPIVNDPVYNNPAFGPLKGKNGITGKTKSELINDLMMTPLCEHSTSVLRSESSCKTCLDQHQWRLPNSYFKRQLLLHDFEENYFQDVSEVNVPKISKGEDGKNPDKIKIDPECPECHQEEPVIYNLEMYLHAWSYTGRNWSFRSNLPYWVEDKKISATQLLTSTQDCK